MTLTALCSILNHGISAALLNLYIRSTYIMSIKIYVLIRYNMRKKHIRYTHTKGNKALNG